MTVSVESRYSDSPIVKMETTRGVVFTIVSSVQKDFVVQYIDHYWQASDRIDLLAYDFYGDPRKWWIIADANPDFLDWTSMRTATRIRIPNA